MNLLLTNPISFRHPEYPTLLVAITVVGPEIICRTQDIAGFMATIAIAAFTSA